MNNKASLLLRNKASLLLRNKASLLLRNKASLLLRNKKLLHIFAGIAFFLLFAGLALISLKSAHASWTTDLTPPTVTITASCTTNCPANTPVNITITCNDGSGSGCQNLPPPSVLGNVIGNIDLAQGTITISGLVTGSNQTITISANATDNAGNISNNGQPTTFNITFLAPLAASCTGTVSDMSINWSATQATGGTSPYSYSWSSTDGLSGTGQTISKTYTTAGEKSATITATDSTSPAITATNSCFATVSCPTAVSCPSTCHTDTQYVSNGSCGQTTCPSNAPPPTTPPACRTTDGTVDNGQCGTTSYLANCSTSCSGSVCLPEPPSLNTTPVTSCLGSSPIINLSWTTSSNASSYDIYRDNTKIDSTTQITYPDSNIANSSTHNYYVVAVNSGGSSTNSNTVSATAPECRPDLIVQNPAVSGTLITGQTLTLSGRVKNQGVSTAGASTTQFKIDGTQVPNGAVATGTIAANSTRTRTASWTATSGDHTLDVCADSSNTPSQNNVIAESNESNNCSSTTTPVTFHVNTPPTCTLINGPATLNPSQSGSYNATAGDPDSTDTISYSWYSTGGTFTSTTSPTPNWSAATPGSYSLNLQVTDNYGATADCPTKVVTVSYPDVSGVSCSADTDSTQVNRDVVWTASGATGGDGTNYTYSWSGTDNLSGSSRSVTKIYSTTGFKTARVTVSSGGQDQTADCTILSGGSNELMVNPEQPVLDPTTPVTQCSVNSSQILVSWRAAAGAASYNVSRRNTPGGSWDTLATGIVGTTYLDLDPTAGSNYEYLVTAVGAGAQGGQTNSSPSNPVTALNCAKPTVDLRVNGDTSTTTIENNQNAFLTWTSENATSCSALDANPPSITWTGPRDTSKSAPGESTGLLTYIGQPYFFTLQCINGNLPDGTSGKTKDDIVSVYINQPLKPFIQTRGGDVHTQQQINAPGGQ